MALLNEAFEGLKVFYENGTTVIYTGARKSDGMPVILKSHKSGDDMFRIKHEYDLLHGREIAGAGNVLEVSYNDDKSYLVLEDTGAIVLDDYFANNEMDAATFLRLAQNAAESLATVHAAGIVHCDIKPANMLVHPETLAVTYIDFGISFSADQREGQKSAGFAGTLEFMAPEQTGRLNMKVDTRSDLYSLGITLYCLLAHELPFKGKNAVEIIHAQTVLPPPPVSQYATVDPTVEAIVMKLLEKSPKRRYQSAESLAYDLGRCLENLAADGAIAPFIPGEKDVLASLEPGERLFGKGKDLAALRALFHATGQGQSALVLLHGPEGSGKSGLLSAFMEEVKHSNGYLLRAAFDWKRAGESYGAIRELFEGFELFAYSSNLPLPEYRRRLLEALGENAGVLCELVPSFTGILGQQPAPPRLAAEEAQERARTVFAKALGVLCVAPYPYVLVFDDAQWADPNSLDLLLSAIESPEVGNCVMVLAFQDDDPSLLKNIGAAVARLDRGSLSVTDLTTAHLDRDGVADLVRQVFGLEGTRAGELAGVLYEATGGVIEKIRLLLQVMYREKQLIHDAENDEWSIHLEDMDAGVLRRLESRCKAEFAAMAEGERALLARLACLGEHFDAADAALALDLPAEELQATLERLAETGWMVRAKHKAGIWAYGQKAMHELAYAHLSEAERVACHRQIVERLYPAFRQDDGLMLRHSALFARQINAVGRKLFSPELLHHIARVELRAAGEFMESANLQMAAETYRNGLRILGRKPFETDYELTYEICLRYALCCFALRHEQRAVALVEAVLLNTGAEAARYNVYYKVVEQYLKRAEWEKAKAYAKRYLGEQGLLLPEGANPLEAGQAEFERFLSLTDGTADPRWFHKMTAQVADEVEHQGNILVMLAEALSFSLDRNCRYYLYKGINLALDAGGLFSEFGRIFSVSAARYASTGEYHRAKEVIDAGLEYAEARGGPQAFLWCVYGNMVTHWVNPLSDVLEIYKKAKYHALVEGNAFYEAYADLMLLAYHSFLGENLEQFHAETQATLHNLERNNLDALRANFVTYRQYARCLLGRTAGSDSFDDAQFTEESLKELKGTWNGVFNEGFYDVQRLRALYIHLHFAEAVQYAERYAAHWEKYNMTAYLNNVQFYYYYSMALLELARLHPDKQDGYIAQIKKNQAYLKRFAQQNPGNFEYKHMLVETGLKGLGYQGIELVDEFAAAHKGFMEKGLLWDAIFVERLIGNFWVARGIPQYEVIHKNNRMVHYKDIGAKVCIRILGETDETSLMRKREARERERLEERARSTGSFGTLARTAYGTHTTFATQYGSAYTAHGSDYTGVNASLDFEALLGVLERLLGQDTMPKLAGEFAALMLQNGNAEKAMLFLRENGVTTLHAAKYAVESRGSFNETELPLALDAVRDTVAPKRIVALALDKARPVCANSAASEWHMTGDAYLAQKAPESFLCLPVLHGDEVLGAVYLENASLPGAFPEGRQLFLQALVHQTSALIVNLQNMEKLSDYTKDLEKRLSGYLAQQNALIAGIAHEINSPVGVCLTVATKIHEKTLAVLDAFGAKQLGKGALQKYLEETRDGLNIINNNVMRAGSLVQNFKKMSVEQSTEVFEILELRPTLESIVEYIRPGVKKKIDHVQVEVPEGLRVYTSSGVLAQIFTNLIMNSAIHGFEDMAKEQCRASITVTDLPATDEIEVVYADNGKGMDAEESEKVFQPFFTTKRNRGGSGLGGHIILTNVTTSLRGSIVCESEPGKGTTFTMRLPKSQPATGEG